MNRTALLVAYNGHAFHGWQTQAEPIATVQRELSHAISSVANEQVILHCAGRTDTGVHASKQIVHFDSNVDRPTKAWVMGANANLGDNVSVEWASAVPETFDARRSATARRYLYIIHNSKVRSALMSEYLTRERRPLDEFGMHQSAQALVGEQDFSSFRASNCQSLSPMRKVMEVSVTRKDDLVLIDIQANAFLHHMVRNIAGVLMDVGTGERPIGWVSELLSYRDRTRGGVTAPPNGLFLVDVQYPEHFGIPQGAMYPHFLRGLTSSGH